jgi:hypothetical protein
MVHELLRDWMPGEWVKEADFSTLERINASYVAENQKQRHDDMVWRLRVGGDRWLWVYLLLEFQSEPETWMALRMLVYVGLLAQDLAKRGELAGGLLPPILPLVLYNGTAAWKAPLEVADLFAPAPPGLDAYRPRLAYHLIDEARLKLHPADTVRTAVEALFRLEHSRTPEDLLRVVHSLVTLLRDPEHESMRHDFSAWVQRLLRRKPAFPIMEPVKDILEDGTMLAERIESWFAEATRKGIQQGLAEGEARGLAEGEARGESKLLSAQLEHRFGSLPLGVSERLARATQPELEAWGKAVLTAPTLEAVFETRH